MARISVDLQALQPISPGASFKGLALFTPGGDCAYCWDQQKRSHWHLDLCTLLQDHLSLSEPPYFLLPCFTATVDRWFATDQQRLVTVAEIYPRVQRFQPLLNILFGLGDWQWQVHDQPLEQCSPLVINGYRDAFPQLWQPHGLVIPLPVVSTPVQVADPLAPLTKPSSYDFRLFVNGADTAATEQMLRLLHRSLKEYLSVPYSLELVDVQKHPGVAETDHITATPTLIQLAPFPGRRIVGNLTNQAELIAQLLG
ncbi:MAG: circadian clock KaiB family protein [Cyanobacteriota bacterium]|jgi:circadian clock protein KaiB|nr:circadian clock KaiB family protein [Cyanobacteriota bacterium]